MIFILWWKKKYQKKVKAAKSEQPGIQLNTLTIKKKNRQDIVRVDDPYSLRRLEKEFEEAKKARQIDAK